MAVSFGGVPLPVLTDAQLGWLARYYRLEDIKIFQPPTWPGLRHAHLPWKPYEIPPIELGRLYWPSGASRFAVAYFVITDDDLDTLRPLAWTSSGSQPLSLVMNDESETDGTSQIAPTMYALPPIPLQRIYGALTVSTQDPLYSDMIADAETPDQVGANTSLGYAVPTADENSLYLLVLVDERYFWWNQIQGSQSWSSSSWEDVINSLVDIVTTSSVTISTIDSAYGVPGWRYVESMNSSTKTYLRSPLPILLDSVLNQISMRLVRNLDGTLLVQSVGDAAQSQLDNQETYTQMAGGRIPQDDLKKSIPASVTVLFDRAFYPLHRDPYTVTVTLASLDLAAYENVTGMSGWTKPLVADISAKMRGSTNDPTNKTTLETTARQMAKDWYLWQLCDAEVHYAGIVPWQPNGMNDYVIWSLMNNGGPCVGTKILRGQQWTVMTPSERELRTESVVVEITGSQRSDGLYPAKVISLDPVTTQAWPIEDALVWEASNLTGVITQNMIGEGAVGTYQIEDGSIEEVDLADGAALTNFDTFDGGTF